MASRAADVVICGAGIAGVSLAYHLAVLHGLDDILLVDGRPPLTLTSDKSTEAYRNWWPGPDPSMIQLMSRSIDLLEDLALETGNRFLLNRRGYLYATAQPEQAEQLHQTARQASQQGAGPLRVYRGQSDDPRYQPADTEAFTGQPTGADLFLDPALIRQSFPYLSSEVVAALHVRRCGWFSGQQLGMILLEQARSGGVELVEAWVEGVEIAHGRVRSVRLSTGESVVCRAFVNAAGPMLRRVGVLLDIDLPVFSELHVKASFTDHLGVIPRDAPLLIWQDAQHLNWSDEERALFSESEDTAWLLQELPAGVHSRPEGGLASQQIIILWPYHAHPVDEAFPIPSDPLFPELALRGMATMIPGLSAYFDRMPRPYVDGGYYTKTLENRPLAGPLPIDGAYVLGALSGFGLMASLGAAEIVAASIVEAEIPTYAAAFSPTRYGDPTYQTLLESWGPSTQL